MKRFFLATLALLSVAGLTSCGVAKGVAETVMRTTQSAGRSVGNLGSAVTR